jgi:hypothetical protein
MPQEIAIGHHIVGNLTNHGHRDRLSGVGDDQTLKQRYPNHLSFLSKHINTIVKETD